jgi:hypothetical protein
MRCVVHDNSTLRSARTPTFALALRAYSLAQALGHPGDDHGPPVAVRRGRPADNSGPGTLSTVISSS